MCCLPRIALHWFSLTVLERNVKTAVENCYIFVVTCVVHVIKPMLSSVTKSLLSICPTEGFCHLRIQVQLQQSVCKKDISTATRPHQAACTQMANPPPYEFSMTAT